MGFRNTAGASKHQAVALMSNSDQSVFYRCRTDAFQDSLYAHANRQFYHECNVYGTVDFIFGNSAVVLQNCNILPKHWPLGNLSSVRTFLGRPWKNYSTTVYMGSMMGSFIDPKGWLPWTGDKAPDTIFYAEYKNFGPGSSTKNRVKWKELRNMTNKQATKFTVKSFIDGDKWLPETGVKHKPGL
ncbi:Pectinesterase [Actinidia chinensis var. chinensis]|uniref:Pectinesterase n=1 Tax=Actinidia chinensis var. chinensis TaxID=1590841 RepID=A0A2R6PKR0_ACTCC|nr:Pectinesterase [Actinidia chinensis var. chinensis]